jgi:hypothetical protein
MTIERAPRPDRYTVIDNGTIEDDRLSFKALGLLVYILSKPDHWRTDRDHLAGTHADGVTAVASALRELEVAGYIERRRHRVEGGQFRWSVTVYDRPAIDGKPRDGADQGERRETPGGTIARFPVDGKPRDVVTTETATTETATTDASPPQLPISVPAAEPEPRPRGHDLTWEAFWNVYPRHVGKREARKAWERAIRRARPEVIIRGAQRYRDDPHRLAPYTAHPATWLNRDGWDDDPEPARSNGNGQTPVAAGYTGRGHSWA